MSTSATQATSGSSTTGYTPQPSSTPSVSSTDVTKNMILQLQVAQLQNQDPLNPADSTQFVGQLAQFQQLETSMNSAQDISAIHTDLDQLVASQTATTGTSGS